MITSIVAAVVIFAVLIIVHEAGHFAMAKRMGVRVLRFSVGYPPRLFGIRRGETDYALGATPFGGYVRMLGDEVADEPSATALNGYLKELELDMLEAARRSGWLKACGLGGDQALLALAEGLDDPPTVPGASATPPITQTGAVAESSAARIALGRVAKPEELFLLGEIHRVGDPTRARERLSEARPAALVGYFNARAFPSQPVWRRVAIVLAGPTANILFAPLLMAVVFMIGVPTLLPVVGDLQPGMPAAAAGLRTGDRILSVNDHAVATWDELSTDVKASAGIPLHVALERPGAEGTTRLDLVIIPRQVSEPTIYGNKTPTWVVGVMPRGDETTRRSPPLKAIGSGAVESVRMAGTLMVGIGKIIDGTTPARQALGGPIMIAQLAGREAHQGFADVALFTVMLSLELGIVNLLPVPLLDGGHLFFFLIEAVRGEPLKLRHREFAMQVGLFLLAILMVFLIVNDISRLVG